MLCVEEQPNVTKTFLIVCVFPWMMLECKRAQDQANQLKPINLMDRLNKNGTWRMSQCLIYKNNNTAWLCANRNTINAALLCLSLAQAMGISPTTLKKLCRHYGIARWPFRQIAGIDRAFDRLHADLDPSLQGSSAEDNALNPVAAHIEKLQHHREEIVKVCARLCIIPRSITPAPAPPIP